MIREGPYRFTRNPQYLGDIAIIGGFILVSNSLMVTVTGLLGIICFILAPFTEEPWLREKFGPTYDEYALKVPRFICLRSRKNTL